MILTAFDVKFHATKMRYLPRPETDKTKSKTTHKIKQCNPKLVPQNPRPPMREVRGAAAPRENLCV